MANAPAAGHSRTLRSVAASRQCVSAPHDRLRCAGSYATAGTRDRSQLAPRDERCEARELPCSPTAHRGSPRTTPFAPGALPQRPEWAYEQPWQEISHTLRQQPTSCPAPLSHRVSTPEAYRWSSAGAHCGTDQPDLALDTDLWKAQWNPTTWKQYLSESGAEADAEAIRQCTHTGCPLGTAEFVESLEKAVGRVLAPQKGGRPTKLTDTKQELFSFD